MILMCRYHMTNVIQTSELVEADGQMSQSCQNGNLLHLAQTVTMEVQHLQAQEVKEFMMSAGHKTKLSLEVLFFFHSQ